MTEIIDKKYYSKQISERFLEAKNEIIAEEKISNYKFGESVGLDSSNILRLEKTPEVNTVPLEALAKLVLIYNYSADWLIKGYGPKKNTSGIEDQLSELRKRISHCESSISKLEAIK